MKQESKIYLRKGPVQKDEPTSSAMTFTDLDYVK